MARRYRVLVGDTEGSLDALARRGGYTILKPVREFSKLDSDNMPILGDIGFLDAQNGGFVALAFKD